LGQDKKSSHLIGWLFFTQIYEGISRFEIVSRFAQTPTKAENVSFTQNLAGCHFDFI
jgi:hypothetical protein